MITQTLLVKPSEIVKQTPLSGNIDVTKYTNVIREVQAFTVAPILGTKLFNKIVADFEADTLSGIYLELFEDYIKWIIIYAVSSEFILTAAYNVTNGGIFKHNPENADPVSKTEIDFLSQNQREKSIAFINRTRDFLCAKRSEIPEYTQNQDNTFDDRPNRGDGFVGGMYLGDFKNRKIWE